MKASPETGFEVTISHCHWASGRATTQGPATLPPCEGRLSPLPFTTSPQAHRDSRKNGGERGHLSSEVGCVGEEEDQQRLDDADPLGEACGQGQEEGKD